MPNPTRRSLLRHVAVAGLPLLLPACGRTDVPQSVSRSDSSNTPLSAVADPQFARGLRHRLNDSAETFTLERLRFEQFWPARLNTLLGWPDWGDYRLSLHDAASEVLIFRQGFETGLAPDAHAATTECSVRFPMPRRVVRASIEKRRGASVFVPLSAFTIDPTGTDIDRSPIAIATRVENILISGVAASKVDIAILGDGYRETDHTKFVDDARRAASYLFSVEPYKSRQGDFNVRAVYSASADSGVTDAYLGLKKNTVFRTAYFSGGSERALADGDHSAVREVASAVPYDFLLVLANARRYGGSAHFGGPAVVAIDSAAARYLVIHEFAHAIAGLADEYYVPVVGGPVYGGNVEPWYPNVTISPESGKWRERMSELQSRPNVWNKTEYDAYFANYVKRYEVLRSNGAEEKLIEQFLAQELQQQAALVSTNNSPRAVGHYEGANGYAKGMFRSEIDCIMFSLQSRYFCAACTAAIERMVDAHVKQ